ncbi:MAG: hypothetical protein Rpha_1268 [Candidatus Ruthia sp. Apha_13_S6]|nr:hypothetical protein [Candidatus Ruthia sp. Apha_13_S6]
MTHIKKPLSEIIEAYFPEWKVNNISSNRNILKTVVTIIPGGGVITSENILKNVFKLINKHLNNKITFKVHKVSAEIFIIDLVNKK